MRGLLLRVFYLLATACAFDPYIRDVNVAVILDIIHHLEGEGTCYSRSGLMVKAGVLRAIQEINDKLDGFYDEVLPDVHINFSSYEYKNDAASMSTGLIRDMTNNFNNGTKFAAGIGPINHNLISSKILREFGIPNLGYWDNNDALSRQMHYPSYWRNRPPSSFQGDLLAKFVGEYFQWDRISIVYSADQSSTEAFRRLNTQAIDVKLNILSSHSLENSECLACTMEKILDIINDLKAHKSRIIVLLLSPIQLSWFVLLGHSSTLIKEGVQLLSWDAASSGYIGLNSSVSGVLGTAKHELDVLLSVYPNLLGEASTETFVTDAFKGMIGIEMKASKDISQYSELSKWMMLEKEVMQSHANVNMCRSEDIDSSVFLSDEKNVSLSRNVTFLVSMLAYDCTVAFAKALHFLLYDSTDRDSILEIADIQSNLLQTPFQSGLSFAGLSGNVSLSRNAINSDIVFNVFNFHMDENLSSGQSAFKFVGEYHWDDGFKKCSNTSHFLCFDFTYNSKGNAIVSYRPSLVTLPPPTAVSCFVTLLATVGIAYALINAWLLRYYQWSRLIRLAHPFLCSIIIIASILSFVSALMVSNITRYSQSTCELLSWVENLAILWLLISLLVKKLRLNVILSASLQPPSGQYFNIATSGSAVIALCLIGVAILLQGINFVAICRDASPQHEIVRDDQEEYSQVEFCPDAFDSSTFTCNYLTSLYALLVLLFSIVLCFWESRPGLIIDEVKSLNKAIVVIVQALSLLVATTVFLGSLSLASQSNEKKVLYSLLYTVIPLWILHLTFFDMWKHLLVENMDLNSNFKFVVIDDSSVNNLHRFLASLSLFHCIKPINVEKHEPKSFTETFASHSSVDAVLPADEGIMIQAEIDILRERLELLHSRAPLSSTNKFNQNEALPESNNKTVERLKLPDAIDAKLEVGDAHQRPKSPVCREIAEKVLDVYSITSE